MSLVSFLQIILEIAEARLDFTDDFLDLKNGASIRMLPSFPSYNI